MSEGEGGREERERKRERERERPCHYRTLQLECTYTNFGGTHTYTQSQVTAPATLSGESDSHMPWELGVYMEGMSISPHRIFPEAVANCFTPELI